MIANPRKLLRRHRRRATGPIVAVIGVRDEVEWIDRVIQHVLRMGVDHVFVLDRNSSDGTEVILGRYADIANVTVSCVDPSVDWAGVKNEVQRLLRACEAEWVLFQDADEFVLCREGDLRECRSLLCADVLLIDRLNVPLTQDGPVLPDPVRPESYDRLLLVADPITDFPRRVKQDPSVTWIHSRVLPKMLARTKVVLEIAPGAHDIVDPPGLAVRRLTPPDMLIAHVPISTMPRFALKVANAEAFLAEHDADFPEGQAAHWRRWIELKRRGELESEFARMIFDAETVSRLRDDGVIKSAEMVLLERRTAA